MDQVAVVRAQGRVTKSKGRTAVIVGALLTLAFATASLAAPSAKIEDDNFSAQATVSGPSKLINPFGGTSRLWFIRGWVDKSSGAATYQLYVQTGYLWHWRFWQAAADDHAGPHQVVPIDRTVEDCGGGLCAYDETVGVELDDAFIRSRAGGFQLKLSGQSGDELILSVSQDQIAPVLAAVDQYEADHHLSATQGHSGPRLGAIFAGTMTVQVEPGSVAAHGGLQPGDLVKAFDGRIIDGQPALGAAIRTVPAGRSVTATVLRGGRDIDLAFQF
jgi:hypothetical protein